MIMARILFAAVVLLPCAGILYFTALGLLHR